jgi:hypothetical protein
MPSSGPGWNSPNLFIARFFCAEGRREFFVRAEQYESGQLLEYLGDGLGA